MQLQNQKIFRPKETSCNLVQHPSQSRSNQARLCGAVSSQGLNTSRVDSPFLHIVKTNPIYNLNFSCCNVCFASHSVTEHFQEVSCFMFSVSSNQVAADSNKVSLNLLQAESAQVFHLPFAYQVHQPHDSHDVLCWTNSRVSMSSFNGKPRTPHGNHGLSSAEQRTRISSLGQPASVLFVQLTRKLVFAARMHCWFMVYLASVGFCNAAFQLFGRMYQHMGLFLPRCRLLHLLLLNFLRFLLTHFSHLSSGLCNMA